MTNLLSSLLSLLLVMGATCWPNYSRAQTQPQVTTHSAAPKVIPFEFVNRHIVIPVKVNNSRTLSFVLDTGDQFAIIALDAARELGLKLRGQVRVGGAGAQLQTGAFVDGATFTVPGLDGFSQRVTLALPIRQLTPRLGHDLDGIIGSEFIEQFVVEIDYQAHVLRLHSKTGFSYRGPGQAIPIKLAHGHPILEAEVTPQGRTPIKGNFVLDIGAGLALALYSPFVAQQGLLSDTKTIRSLSGAGAGGETNGRLGRVSELKIGKYVIGNHLPSFLKTTRGLLRVPH